MTKIDVFQVSLQMPDESFKVRSSEDKQELDELSAYCSERDSEP